MNRELAIYPDETLINPTLSTKIIISNLIRWMTAAADISGAIAETHLVVTAGFIAFSYVVGGIIPLFPYILISDSHTDLLISASVTLLALFCFGLAKGYFTGASLFKSGLQTVFVGGIK